MPNDPLRSLSKKPPDELRLAIREAAEQEKADRGTALVLASLIEAILRGAIRTSFNLETDAKLLSRLYGEYGALSDLAKVSQIARAINLIGPTTDQNIKYIKNIRNAFAHSLTHISFETPEISKECAKMTLDVSGHSVLPILPSETSRDRFIFVCDHIYQQCITYAISAFLLGTGIILRHNEPMLP